MSIFNRRNPHSVFKPEFDCSYIPELPVKAGLSVTPSQMMDLTQRGLSVSNSNNLLFVDGVLEPSFDIPINERRGVDVNDVWNAQVDSRRKLIDYSKRQS